MVNIADLLTGRGFPVIQSVDIAPVNPDTYGIGKEEESSIPLIFGKGYPMHK